MCAENKSRNRNQYIRVKFMYVFIAWNTYIIINKYNVNYMGYGQI